MIPDLPKSVDMPARLDFYSTLASNLQTQGTIHTNWHTHRQNPAICWICDTFILMQRILDTVESYITKSSVDIETDLSSVTDSESEIENEDSEEESEMIASLEDDSTYNEPEYTLEDES